jgi:hypothetical protein
VKKGKTGKNKAVGAGSQPSPGGLGDLKVEYRPLESLKPEIVDLNFSQGREINPPC